jgi:hypothetical protein
MSTTEGDSTSRSETFYGNEYKALRDEITTKLRDRLEFNRWGLIGLAALYSYIFSNPGKPILFWVPVALSVAMIAHLNGEHRIIFKAASYIRDKVEPWANGVADAPTGWETYLRSQKDPPLWQFWRRWPTEIWGWTPVPLWIVVFGLTLVIAIGVSAGLWPSLIRTSAGWSD